MKTQFTNIKFLILAIITLWSVATTGKAQTTQFTYQGRLNDASVAVPTNGTYEMQFKLFNTGIVGTGAQVGATQIVQSVSVVNGIFTVQLDAANSFNGADLYIEISVRPAGSQIAPTTLSPRQQVTSAPYAIQSKNALTATNSDNLGNLPASKYTQNTDSRLSDDRNPTAGSANYVQNQSAVAQTSANFNISGTGKANIFNAATQYNIGGIRFLSGDGGNIFAGDSAGAGNTTGIDNAFVGTRAGLTNTTGFNNSFFGTDAGRSNTANDNSFFGRSAGYDNMTGTQNSFFGEDAGRFNNTGTWNSFFGTSAGKANTTGGSNSYFGRAAGASNIDGFDNSIFGRGAGQLGATGNNNSFFGSDAGRNNAASYNSFFGRSAGFDTTSGDSNSFFGVDAGRFNQTGANNSFFGIGAGKNNLTGATNAFFGVFAGQTNVAGSNNTALGNRADFASNNLNFATAIGAGSVAPASNTIALGRSDGSDTVRIFGLGTGGTTTLCRNASNQISTCAASGGTVNNGDFIQNQQTSPQSADFSISGSGRVGQFFSAAVVSTETFYRIGTQIIFNTPNATSVAVGQSSGFNATGGGNSFFGTQSGNANTSGERNSYFGSQAGQSGNTAGGNSFFGYQAGKSNVGSSNTFLGSNAGSNNVSGSNNTLVGNSSGANGDSNTAAGAGAYGGGSDNAIFGAGAGGNGSGNTFIGAGAGGNGSDNTLIGARARIIPFNPSFTPSNSTAVGAGAVIQFSHQVVLGTQDDEVDVPGKANISGSIYSNGVTTTTLTVIGGNIKFTTVQLPSVNGNRHLCLNDKSFVSLCPEDAFLTSGSTSSKESQPQQTKQIEVQAAQIKQQQTQLEKQGEQIEAQQEQLKQQQVLIESLRKLVCASNSTADMCREVK